MSDFSDKSSENKKLEINTTDFVWEAFQIKFRSDLIIQAQNMSTIEKMLGTKEFALTQKFLLRIKSDVGLNLHIIRQLKDQEENTKRQILDFIRDYTLSISEMKSKFNDESLLFLLRLTKPGWILDDDKYEMDRQITFSYYISQLQKAHLNEDKHRIKAVNNLLQEGAKMEDNSYLLFIQEDEISGVEYQNKYKTESDEFIRANVKFQEMYDLLFDEFYPTSNRNTEYSKFNSLTKLIYICRSDVFSIIQQILIPLYSVKDEDLSYYDTFCFHVVEILFFRWFWDISLQEKLDVLNTSYKVSNFEISGINMVMRKSDPNLMLDEISDISRALLDNAFYTILEEFFILLDAKIDFPDQFAKDFRLLSIFLMLKAKRNSLIEISRNEYQELLQFVIASDEEEIDISSFVLALDLAIGAEYDEFKAKLMEVYQTFIENPNFTIDNKQTLMEDIAIVYREHQKFDMEQKLLGSIYGNLTNQGKSVSDHIQDRLYTLLNSHENFKEYDKHTTSKVEFLVNKEIVIKMLDLSLAAINNLNSFNFEIAESLLLQIDSLFDNYNLTAIEETRIETQSYLGLVYLNQNHLENAFDIYVYIFENECREHTNLHNSVIRDHSILVLLHIILEKDVSDEFRKYFGSLNEDLQKQSIETFIRYYSVVSDINQSTNEFRQLQSLLSLNTTEFFFYVGQSLQLYGFINTAITYFKEAYDIITESKLKANCINALGDCYTLQNEFVHASNAYVEAIEFDIGNIEYTLNLARSHANSLNYTKATEVYEDILSRIESEDVSINNQEELLKEVERFKRLATNMISIQKIPEEHTILTQLLSSGDFYFQTLLREKTVSNLDASVTFSSYFRAIERMLDMSITQPFKTYMSNSHQNQLGNFIRLNRDRNKSLIAYFTKNVTLSPGQWKYILNNATDQFHTYLFDYMNLEFGSNLKIAIKKIMNIIINIENVPNDPVSLPVLRNKISHNETLDFETVVTNRGTIVQGINSLIEILYQ